MAEALPTSSTMHLFCGKSRARNSMISALFDTGYLVTKRVRGQLPLHYARNPQARQEARGMLCTLDAERGTLYYARS